MEIVFSTEDVNRYGYRVLTAGIDISAYLKNPVLMLNHDTWNLPIGKVEKLRKENGRLIGSVVFDEDDEKALNVKRKFEKGMLNAASIQIAKTEMSTDKSILLKGQTRATVTKSELMELSIATIPGNSQAVRLNLDEGESLESILPKLNFSKPTLDMDYKNIAAKLNLGEDASEVQILNAIEGLQTDSAKLSANEIDAVIDGGKAKGFINDDNEADLRTLAATNLDSVKSLVDKAKAAPVKKEKETEAKLLSAALGERSNLSTKDTDDRADWKFDQWSKEDSAGLLNMKNNDPERYVKLSAEYLKDSRKA